MNTQTLLISILIVLVFGLGFFLGRMTSPQIIMSDGTAKEDSVSQMDNNAGQSGEASVSESDSSTTVESSSMTDGQRKLISALGMDPNSVTITNEMVVCAETKIGVARVEEIKNGATPSFSEGVSLVACYNN